MARADGRQAFEIRPVRITTPYMKYPEGSALIEAGDTKVICTATIEAKVPGFLRGKGQGWVTAEYGMLPRATEVRTVRDATRGRVAGRSQEIQRLIGRSIRAVIEMPAMGERTVWIDCDVLQADGGTRTASITGAYVAVVQALAGLVAEGEIKRLPVTDLLAAVSVGKVGEELLLDLDFAEDSQAGVDMNVVMTGAGKLVEVQGTAEQTPFTREELQQMLDLAAEGIARLCEVQRQVFAGLGIFVGQLQAG
ncbi:MAG: ribonuclease PH [Clostridia bacterium]|nr:MAG: ribonuclease PH [Clostridia bacterium]